MFGRLATLAHGLRVPVEALLYGLKYMFMLPAGNASLRAGGAAFLERTMATCIRPVAPQFLPVLFVRVIVFQLFAGRTAIHILVAEIDEVLLAKTTLCLNARRHRFGKCHGNAGLVTCKDFLAAVVAPIGNGLEFVNAEDFLRLASDVCELRSI